MSSAGLAQERRGTHRWPLILHVNYFEPGLSWNEICRTAKESGADGVEFRQIGRDFAGTWMEYLDELARALERHPVPWISFGGPGVNLMGCDDEARKRSLDDMARFYATAAQRFSVKTFNAFTGQISNPDASGIEFQHHGSALATDRQWEQAICGYQFLAQIALEHHFSFAFETHGHYLHDKVETSLRLVEAIASPQVGVLWDHANLMLFPKSPEPSDVVRQLGKRLLYVHLKNYWQVTPTLMGAPLGDGVINIREQLQLLHEASYQGAICIESPRAGDRLHFLKSDISYLRDLMQDYPV